MQGIFVAGKCFTYGLVQKTLLFQGLLVRKCVLSNFFQGLLANSLGKRLSRHGNGLRLLSPGKNPGKNADENK